MSKKVIAKGNWVELVEDEGWEYTNRIRGTSAVIIPTLTKDNEYIFVEQFRKPVDGNTIEWPAGLVGDEDGQEDEDIVVAACRELEEEAGYKANVTVHTGSYAASAGAISEMLNFVLCMGCEQVGEGGGIDGENITVHVVPKDDVMTWMNARAEEGFILDAKLYSGIFLLENYS